MITINLFFSTEECKNFYTEVTKFIKDKRENKTDESSSEVDSSKGTTDASNQEPSTTVMADQRSEDTGKYPS